MTERETYESIKRDIKKTIETFSAPDANGKNMAGMAAAPSL